MSLLEIGILVIVLLTVGGSVYLVHRYWPYERRQEHTDVAGFIFAGVAVLYAVMLAFVVIAGWDNLDSARATTYNEADQLSNVYWISHSLPSPRGAVIDGLAVKYAHTVIDREWPLMERGESSPEAQAILGEIREDVFGFRPKSSQQQVLYEQAVVSVDGLNAARRDRLDAMSEVVPEPLWVALIGGAVITISFCLLFGLKSKTVHIGMVAGITALITVLILLIYNIQFPFAGNPRISPEAFEIFLRNVSLPR